MNLELAVLDILPEPVPHHLVAVHELLVGLRSQRSLKRNANVGRCIEERPNVKSPKLIWPFSGFDNIGVGAKKTLY